MQDNKRNAETNSVFIRCVILLIKVYLRTKVTKKTIKMEKHHFFSVNKYSPDICCGLENQWNGDFQQSYKNLLLVKFLFFDSLWLMLMLG